MMIPLLDLKRQYKEIGSEIQRSVLDLLESGNYVLGPAIERFEVEVAAYCGADLAISCASGTDALLLALMSIDIGKADEVITTPYSFFSTASVIWRLSAKPVFCDIDTDTYNINPDLIEAKITDKTRAILPVHLYGQTADMDKIMEIARRHNLFVIEDGAQALGAEYKGKKAGTLSDIGCFSFFPTKNLGGYGDGGMIVTDNKELADKMRMLRVHGSSPKYYHKVVGINSRLDAIQAVALSCKLKYLGRWNEARRRNAALYNELLAKTDIILPKEDPDCKHIYNQYTIRCKDRDGLREYLKAKAIATEIYYPLPLHLQECFKDLGQKEGDFPEAESSAKETLSIPIYPELTEGEIREVADTIKYYTYINSISSKGFILNP
ncbi:MAG: DegT/DnrJ/EryC1/StrS family aminotransferase [bacterium]|nr:DegT/DnrJ/EryC1/StrS family aminotransferase [bacterium]